MWGTRKLKLIEEQKDSAVSSNLGVKTPLSKIPLVGLLLV